MKITFASMAATLVVLTSCTDTGGPVYSSAAPGGRSAGLTTGNLSPAYRAAADARRSPGFVATPAPKFSGAGTPQPTRGYFPADRRSRNYNSYGSPYGNGYGYGVPYGYGSPYGGGYGNPYGYRRF